MSVELIRRALRVATVLAWGCGIIAALTINYCGHRASVPEMILGAVLIAVITAAAAVVEVIILLAERIIAKMPAADEVAARALLAGQKIAQERHDAEADLPKISDYRH